MTELICGECRACCQWNGETGLRPRLTVDEALLLKHEVIEVVEGTQVNQITVLAAKQGGCVYLGDKGCTEYEGRPQQCKDFDCRELYKQMKTKTFVCVLVKGRELLEV